jgi:signal transduction histidine kinase
LDTDWHEVDSKQRTASYTTLPAATYTFRVQSATSRGRWNSPGATLRIEILPAWWNRWWFRGGCIAVAILALFGFYQYRLHQLAQAFKGRMEERVMERTRIARELHDTLLQSFYGLVLSFEAAISMLPPETPAYATLKSVLARADKALAEGRDRVYGLRIGTDDLQDLSARIGALLEEMKALSEATFTLRTAGSLTAYDPVVCSELYQIAREALMNAARHSGATAIVTSITALPASLRLDVSDNGRGIEPELLLAGGRSGHWGLLGMRERARQIGSEIRITSFPGAGTAVSLEVPMTPAKHRSTDGKGDHAEHGLSDDFSG